MVLVSVIRQSLQKRIPMIKFRKGGLDNVIAASIVNGNAQVAAKAAVSVSKIH